MGLCEYVPLLIAFIAPIYLDRGSADLQEEAAAAKKFTPFEDAEVFLKTVKTFGEGFGTKWMVMPDGNNTAQMTVLDPEMKPLLYTKIFDSDSFEIVAKMVAFNYFSGNPKESKMFKLKDINDLKFLNTKPTKLLIHGWMADSTSSSITSIANAYAAEKDVNVIGVDWGSISQDWYYPNVAKSTKVVGEVVGKMINSLVKTHGARYSDFHMIGHSLGAHVAGLAGSSTEGKVGRITGLDPALPGFENVVGPERRLDKSDAEFVDVIHTCAGILGMSEPIGHVDFYPNGGSIFQPGCTIDTDLLNFQSCSHSRALQFFSESVSTTSSFEAIKCPDWEHFKKNKCENVYTKMGENISQNAKPGVYYLTTNWAFPYSQGKDGTKF